MAKTDTVSDKNASDISRAKRKSGAESASSAKEKGGAEDIKSAKGKIAASPASSAKKTAPAYEGESAKKAAREFDLALEARYPAAECSLEYRGGGWRLLVMARLSAQCTDERVNEVCAELFGVFPDAQSMAAGDIARIERIIRPCGLFRGKAVSIRDFSAIICEKHGGAVPRDMDALLALPGVGRKIANLVLGDVYGLGGIVADTHFMRICSRVGFTPAGTKDPVLTERVMDALIPRERQSALCHRAVLFGREVCEARSPRCGECPLAGICASRGEASPQAK